MIGFIYRAGISVREFGAKKKIGFIFRIGVAIKDFGASALI